MGVSFDGGPILAVLKGRGSELTNDTLTNGAWTAEIRGDNCYLGICSAGNGSGVTSAWNQFLLEQVMRSKAQDALSEQFAFVKQRLGWAPVKLGCNRRLERFPKLTNQQSARWRNPGLVKGKLKGTAALS